MKIGKFGQRLKAQGACAALLGAFILTASHASVFADDGRLRTVKIPIDGICIAGLTDIREGLRDVKGISHIKGAMLGDGVEVTYDPQTITSNRVKQLIADLGYGQRPPER